MSPTICSRAPCPEEQSKDSTWVAQPVTNYLAGHELVTATARRPHRGSLRWSYNLPTGDRWLLAGPGVGPDGNIYAVQDTLSDGNGAFALDSGGNLLWTRPGPGDFSGNNYELLFTADRFIAPYEGNHIAYDFDGNILWDASEMGLNQGSLAVHFPDVVQRR